jgi:hypothetical protein
MASNPLIGTWKLVSWENRSLDGQVTYPLGEDAVGYISYTQDGYVFVSMMRSDRTEFTSGDLLRASAQEKVHAAETYVTYCGRYDFRGNTVVHHVELSLFPNWVGVDQERLVEIAGNRLTVSTRPMLLEGIQRSGHLVWERVQTS